jgi:hypothetical protein
MTLADGREVPGRPRRRDAGMARLAGALRRASRADRHHRPRGVDRRLSGWARPGSRSTLARHCALLGVAVITALWCSYFDWVAFVAQTTLAEATGPSGARLARDAYPDASWRLACGLALLTRHARSPAPIPRRLPGPRCPVPRGRPVCVKRQPRGLERPASAPTTRRSPLPGQLSRYPPGRPRSPAHLRQSGSAARWSTAAGIARPGPGRSVRPHPRT